MFTSVLYRRSLDFWENETGQNLFFKQKMSSRGNDIYTRVDLKFALGMVHTIATYYMT